MYGLDWVTTAQYMQTNEVRVCITAYKNIQIALSFFCVVENTRITYASEICACVFFSSIGECVARMCVYIIYIYMCVLCARAVQSVWVSVRIPCTNWMIMVAINTTKHKKNFNTHSKSTSIVLSMNLVFFICLNVYFFFSCLSGGFVFRYFVFFFLNIVLIQRLWKKETKEIIE